VESGRILQADERLGAIMERRLRARPRGVLQIFARPIGISAGISMT
jgi:hypothetical protein